MGRIASTTTAGVPVDPTGGMTLDALMARQKEIAAQRGQIAAPREMRSPWQGAAMLGQTLVNNLESNQADSQLAAGRDAFAKVMSGINMDTGATSEQIAELGRLSPEDARAMMQMAVEAMRAKRQREQQLADVQTGYAHEATVDQRELGQSRDATAASNAFTHGENQMSRQAAIDAAAKVQAQPDSPEGKIMQDYNNGAYGPVGTPDAMKLRDAAISKATMPAGPNVQVMTGEVEARKKIATDLGMKEGSPEWMSYVATGNIPKEAQQSATDKKAIITADDLVSTNQSVIDELGKVISGAPGQTLNERAGSGAFAQSQAFAARNDPTGWFDDNKGQATTELNNVITGTALASLRSIFGGNPTEGERKVLLDMQASVDKSPPERKAIIERAIELANVRLSVNKQRAQELRGGTFFQPGGGSAAGAGIPAPVAPPAPVSDLPEGVSEESLQHTMTLRKMTREQVLQALAAKRKAP
jgi:hypothetical protein